ncbi:MAG: cytochrome b/b6 domain-containing protein, partial [Desulfobacterales bacterium]
MRTIVAALLRRGFVIGCMLAISALSVFVPPAYGGSGTISPTDDGPYESSGLFEEYDVTDRFFLSLPGGPRHPEGLESLRLRGNTGRFRSYMADSHWGLRINRIERCFDCHPEEARNIHSARAKITCRQCHTDEPIAGISHFYSLMNPIRRHAYVCAKCHEGANVSYATYLVHSPNPGALATREVFPLLFYAFWGLTCVALGTFIVFLPHTFLWGVREFIAGRKKASGRLIRRFTPVQRLFHLLLLLSFLSQSVTGLARMYIETRWGTMLASPFGGTYGALAVHKWGGIFMLVLFAVHLVYVLRNIDWRHFFASIFGPDSILPHWTDVKLAFQHVGWFFGLAEAPRFGRWGYWEKIDYLAVFWGTMVLGVTGLLLFDALVSSRYVPGWSLNIAMWIHRIEAMLAMAHVFIIHFFIGHLR